MEVILKSSDLGSVDYSPLSFKNSISSEDFTNIYKPNDDSYQMLFSLILFYQQRRLHRKLQDKDFQILNIMEIGSGSGFVIGNLIKFISSQNSISDSAHGVAVDLNLAACKCAEKFFRKHDLLGEIDLVNGDGLACLDVSDFGILFIHFVTTT